MSTAAKPLYLVPSRAIAARMLGGEMMIMSVRDSTFFTLNEVASVIWRAADGRTPLEQIVAQTVCEEFDVDFETARRDAEEVVRQLAEHGILLVSDAPIDAPAPSAAP